MFAQLRFVPARGIGRVHFQKSPEHIGRGVALFPRNKVPYHDEALGYPMPPIGFAQHAERQRLLDVLQLDPGDRERGGARLGGDAAPTRVRHVPLSSPTMMDDHLSVPAPNIRVLEPAKY